MKRVAFFGGAFNPIHNGHLHLVEFFCDRLQFDRVLLIPSRISPHKDSGALIGGEHRLAMCRIAVRGTPLCVSAMELCREGKSFTVDTVRQLQRAFPENELYMIVGSDMFLTLDTWRRAEEIIRSVTACAAAREAGEYERLLQKQEELKRKGGRSIVCPMEAVPVSSTLIRERIKEGLPVEEYLPAGVEHYIREHHLYQT